MKKLNNIIVKKLIKKKIKISIAESCTGGMLASSIISVRGASNVFNVGIVSYSNKAKINVLKVSKNILAKYGAVSEQVCRSMAENVSKIGKSKLSVSVTGIAGPTGGTKKKPVGLVYIGIKLNNKVYINKCLFQNKGRSYIRNTTVNKCLKLILRVLK
tara:strand:- start:1299 stop:1772 length:474 start_codon:yes stop_codon:yes gene_type:complete